MNSWPVRTKITFGEMRDSGFRDVVVWIEPVSGAAKGDDQPSYRLAKSQSAALSATLPGKAPSPPGAVLLVGGGREKTTAEAATMSDKSLTGEDEIDLALITLALMESDFDLDKVVKRFKGLGEKRRIRDVLAQAEVRLDKVERSTHDPASRLAIRRLLADMRKGLPEGS